MSSDSSLQYFLKKEVDILQGIHYTKLAHRRQLNATIKEAQEACSQWDEWVYEAESNNRSKHLIEYLEIQRQEAYSHLAANEASIPKHDEIVKKSQQKLREFKKFLES